MKENQYTGQLAKAATQCDKGEDKARQSQYLLTWQANRIRWFHVSSGRRVHPPSKLQNHSFQTYCKFWVSQNPQLLQDFADSDFLGGRKYKATLIQA